MRIDDVPVDAKLLRREPKRQPHKLRQMQHRHIELLAHVLLDLALEAVKHGMAEGTRCHHRLRAGAFCRLDVLTGELDGNPLVMGGGMESAALGTSAVVDGLAAQQLREPLQCDVVARIDKTITLRRTRDVAAVKGGHGKSVERLDDELAQPIEPDIFIKNPEKMADAGSPAVAQALGGQARIDRLAQTGLFQEGRVRIEQVERAGVADGHERQTLPLGERENAQVQGEKTYGVDGPQLARAGAGCGLDSYQIEAETCGDAMGRFVELGARAARGATGVIRKLHGVGPLPASNRRAGRAAAVRSPSSVRSGLILPRMSIRHMRGKLRNAESPCTPSTSAPGSTRPRAATIRRRICECRAIAGTSTAARALSGSIA